jgi:acyl-CoA thioester hydrolase
MSYKHEIEVRIYYQDTDALGIVYHANYLNYAERGRMEYFRSRGGKFNHLMKDHGLMTVARHIDVEYFGAARLNDVLRVVTYAEELRNSSFVMHSDMYIGDKLINSVKMVAVLVNDQMKPIRMTDDIKATIV